MKRHHKPARVTHPSWCARDTCDAGDAGGAHRGRWLWGPDLHTRLCLPAKAGAQLLVEIRTEPTLAHDPDPKDGAELRLTPGEVRKIMRTWRKILRAVQAPTTESKRKGKPAFAWPPCPPWCPGGHAPDTSASNNAHERIMGEVGTDDQCGNPQQVTVAVLRLDCADEFDDGPVLAAVEGPLIQVLDNEHIGNFTAAQARQHGRHLIAAADLIDAADRFGA